MCYASNCCKMKYKRIQQSNRALYSFKWIYCQTRLKAKIQIHSIFITFPCYLKCLLYIMCILSLLNSTVSEQLSRDSNVKWSDIDILFLILARLFLPGSIGKNIGDIEHESVVVPNTSIHCLLWRFWEKQSQKGLMKTYSRGNKKDKINKILLFWGYLPEIPAVVFHSGTMTCYETLKFFRGLGDIEMTACQYTGDEY